MTEMTERRQARTSSTHETVLTSRRWRPRRGLFFWLAPPASAGPSASLEVSAAASAGTGSSLVTKTHCTAAFRPLRVARRCRSSNDPVAAPQIGTATGSTMLGRLFRRCSGQQLLLLGLEFGVADDALRLQVRELG